MTRQSVENLAQLAASLSRSALEDEPLAVERILTYHPEWPRFWRSRKSLTLPDCQLVVAREYGFDSWPMLERAARSALVEVPVENEDRYFEMVDRLKIKAERPRWNAVLSAKPGQMGRANRGQPLPPEKREALIWGLSHDNASVRWQCLEHLDAHPHASAVAEIVRLLDDPVPRVRWHAIHALSCDACKDGATLMDVAIRERIEAIARNDGNARVKRYAAEVVESCSFPVIAG